MRVAVAGPRLRRELDPDRRPVHDSAPAEGNRDGAGLPASRRPSGDIRRANRGHRRRPTGAGVARGGLDRLGTPRRCPRRLAEVAIVVITLRVMTTLVRPAMNSPTS